SGSACGSTQRALSFTNGFAFVLWTLTLAAVGIVIVAPRAAAQQPGVTAPTPILSIGVESGDPSTEFGNIDGIAIVDSKGVLLVLDRLNHRLSAFSMEGRFLA